MIEDFDTQVLPTCSLSMFWNCSTLIGSIHAFIKIPEIEIKQSSTIAKNRMEDIKQLAIIKVRELISKFVQFSGIYGEMKGRMRFFAIFTEVYNLLDSFPRPKTNEPSIYEDT
jgi:hypothetical protein